MRDRGLLIADEAKVIHYLKHIGYYRLSIYMLPFQRADKSDRHHNFASGTKFEDILHVYDFDRKLRLLVIDALERIEISIKSVMIDTMCVSYGSHWFMSADLFNPDFKHTEFLNKIRDQIGDGTDTSKMGDIAIRHYFETYDYPPMPPMWMLTESLTFGTISVLYSQLIGADQKRIADGIGIPVPMLKSWLRSASYMRNLCAHHSRLWNRVFTIRPASMKQYVEDFTPNTLFYAQAVALNIFMQKISPETRWASRLSGLLAEYPMISKSKMGFPDDWERRDVWNIRS